MKREIPKSAQAQHDFILAKLLDLLARAPEHTSARSEYMDYGGSTGGLLTLHGGKQRIQAESTPELLRLGERVGPS